MGSKKKVLTIVGIAVLAIIMAVFIGIIAYNNSIPVKLSKQLELGQKYLTEQDYEQAVVAYQAAIEIDPMNVDAYLGLADAYIGQGDLEKAAEVLQTGYDATADERLKDKLEEVTTEIERIKAEEEAARLAAEKAAAEAAEKARREAVLKELYELIEADDDEAVVEYVNAEIFQKDWFLTDSYSPSGDTENGTALDISTYAWNDLNDEEIMEVYIFCGEKTSGSYESTGKWYVIEEDEIQEEGSEYCKYEGAWKNGKPNGKGTYTEIRVYCYHSDGDGSKGWGDYDKEEGCSVWDEYDKSGIGVAKLVVSGGFADGYYHGDMTYMRYNDIYNELDWWSIREEENHYVAENGNIVAGTYIFRQNENGSWREWGEFSDMSGGEYSVRGYY